MGARVCGDEFVDEGVARHHRCLGEIGHAVHGVGMDGAVEMDRVREVVGVAQRHPHTVALLDADGRASVKMARVGAASEAIQPRRVAHITSACN